MPVPDVPIVDVPGEQKLFGPLLHKVYDSKSSLVSALSGAFHETLSTQPDLAEIFHRLTGAGITFGILGGWTRDFIFALNSKQPFKPRDMDVVAVEATHDQLRRILPQPSERTMLGGFTFRSIGNGLDVWGGRDTFLAKRFHLPRDIFHILAVTDFNINSVVFLPRNVGADASLLDAGCLASFEAREIDFHFERIQMPVAQVARLLTLSLRLRFSFSASVKSFILSYTSTEAARTEVRNNLLRYRPNEVDHAVRYLDLLIKEPAGENVILRELHRSF